MIVLYILSGTTAWSASGRFAAQFQEDDQQGERGAGLRQQTGRHEVKQEGEWELSQEPGRHKRL